jgi:uncharacterized membrane protein
MGASVMELCATWGSIYANHAALRTIVAFAHVGALIAGGGAAVASDRAILSAAREGDAGRRSQLAALRHTHLYVVAGLALVVVSGLLLFASDVDTFLYSRFFWAKMGLVMLLLINGTVLVAAERRAERGDEAAWSTLRLTAFASITLWFLTTLGGVALPNIG